MFGESGNSLQTVRKPSGGLCVIFFLFKNRKQPPWGWVHKDLALMKKSWCTTSSAHSSTCLPTHVDILRAPPLPASSSLWHGVQGNVASFKFTGAILHPDNNISVAAVGEYLPWTFFGIIEKHRCQFQFKCEDHFKQIFGSLCLLTHLSPFYPT